VRVRPGLLFALPLAGCSSLLGIEDLALPDGVVPPDMKTQCEEELFDPPLDAPWTEFAGQNATTLIDGELVVRMASVSNNDYAGATLSSRDLSGVTMEVDVLSFPQKSGSDAHAQFRRANEIFTLHFEPGTVTLEETPGNSIGPFPILPGDLTYRLEHRPERNEIAGAVLRNGAWVPLGAVNADFPATNMNVVLTAGTFIAVDTPGEVIFDNLRLFCP
jgi:hypothetical protein